MRARELGIVIGRLPAGVDDAITDVPGVRVGHSTIVEGEGPLVVGTGPVRTGVTVVLPHGGDVWTEPVFAGCHRLNGNGELTGLEWVREAGQVGGAIAITNTHSVGVVRDALVAYGVRHRRPGGGLWSLPVVGETWDGLLSDVDGQHVRPSHVADALAAAEAAGDGPIPEGNVGGGTGMVCHGFKGGIGTASRQVDGEGAPWTVGVLVQANYGNREDLRVDGVPVGAELGAGVVPVPAAPRPVPHGAGSIIGLVATDAPLLPHQCQRLAQRAALGVGRMGGTANNSSGDLFLAFATGNRGLPAANAEPETAPPVSSLRMVPDSRMTPLFKATVEATEAAIVAALLAAETMTGRDGITAHALGAERLIEVMGRYGRGPAAVR